MKIKKLNFKILQSFSIFSICLIILYLFSHNFFFSFVISFFLIELFFGSWLLKNNFSSLIIPRNITKVWEPKHYNSKHAAMYKRDENGFRGDFIDVSSVDIVTLGGSTTDERWIDEKLTWSHLLQEELALKGFNIKVANAGVDGQSTLGHLFNFDMWFNKIPNFKPKIFLLYIGINDSAALLRTLNSNKFEKFLYRSDYLLDRNIYARIFKYLKNNSFIYKVHKLKSGIKEAKKYNLIHSTDTWNEKNISKPYEFKYNNITQKFSNEYKDRLKTLIDKIGKFGSEAIVITQTLSPNHILFNLLKYINEETKKVCNIKSINCLCLDDEPNFYNKVDFYDGIHTRPSGNRKIAKYISEKIQKKLKEKI